MVLGQGEQDIRKPRPKKRIETEDDILCTFSHLSRDVCAWLSPGGRHMGVQVTATGSWQGPASCPTWLLTTRLLCLYLRIRS